MRLSTCLASVFVLSGCLVDAAAPRCNNSGDCADDRICHLVEEEGGRCLNGGCLTECSGPCAACMPDGECVDLCGLDAGPDDDAGPGEDAGPTDAGPGEDGGPDVDAGPGVIDAFTATLEAINLGSSVTFDWTVDAAATCTFDGEDADVPSGSATVAPTVDQTFTLACDSPGGSDSASINIEVSRFVLVAEPAQARDDEQVNLSVDGEHVDGCTVDGTALPADFDVVAGDNAFTATCNGAEGDFDGEALTVTALGAPTVNFSAPGAVAPGTSKDIVWSATGAERCELREADGTEIPSDNAASGSTPFQVDESQTLTLTCTLGAISRSATLDADILVVLSNPAVRVVPGPPEMTWTAVGAESCTIDGAATTTDESHVLVDPGTTGVVTHTVTCTGSSGDTADVSVNVWWGNFTAGDLGNLGAATVVTGNVSFSGTTLAQFEGAEALVEVGGLFEVRNNGSLLSIPSTNFPALARIGGGLDISSNAIIGSAEFVLLELVLRNPNTQEGVLISGNPSFSGFTVPELSGVDGIVRTGANAGGFNCTAQRAIFDPQLPEAPLNPAPSALNLNDNLSQPCP